MNDKPGFLIDLTAIVLSAAVDDTTRIPLAMVGTFWKGKQKFTITRADVAHASAELARRGECVMDYEHASEFPEVAQGQPIPAAGWIVSMDADPDARGVVWGKVKFTERARGLIAAREYKFVSPALKWGVRDSGTGEQASGMTLTSAALTNTPVLDQMPAITLSSAGWKKEEGEDMAKKVMCAEHPDTAMLCPTCDADAMKQMMASAAGVAATVVLRLSAVDRDGEGRITLSRVQAGTFVDIEVVRAMETERIALSAVDAAFKAGKITAAQKPFYTRLALSNFADFEALEKTLGVAVDLTERGHGGSGAGLPALAELDQINVQLSQHAAKRAKDDSIPYGQALKLVTAEHPDLNTRRNVLTRRLAGKGDDE